MDISDLIKKHSLSAIEKVKRINPSAYWGDVKLEDVLTYTELDWLKNNFTNFSLKNYTSLLDLDLTGVPCDAICDDFFESKSLQDISKLGGKLKLNKSFCSLINLKKINFGAVYITSLPKDFGNLGQLEELLLNDTSIKKLPTSFSNLTSLKKLTIYNKLINIDVDFPASLQEIDFRGNKLSELPKSLFSLPKLQHLDISDNPFIELPFVKNNALKTLKIARTPFGIFKSNIIKTKQFYANCEVEEAVKYADDKTLYLSATKKYYSSIHPSGYHSYH
ncbi:leucine-rich repeat domain-containing protein [bacterium]|nr:leucine-rich repeat domain-containing protein [bacterium]